ncbi:hypothetical protein RFI_32026 [Reticulomyxa filosa]|uniref:Uncharacterized protein n=1 Tax=Reticulomyxa filosa TaxID=46433 RepID=X6LXF3_RETFI|nr:hypothetical protein RFI_32026 [Reticulomyxa filosa]|eukprot:ETO05370.1 hypothetical protein RFI_32026 [Reticulomyxa filosa]
MEGKKHTRIHSTTPKKKKDKCFCKYSRLNKYSGKQKRKKERERERRKPNKKYTYDRSKNKKKGGKKYDYWTFKKNNCKQTRTFVCLFILSLRAPEKSDERRGAGGKKTKRARKEKESHEQCITINE